MAFTVTFYNISDPPNKLSKTIGTALKTSTCTPFKPVSDLTGTILLDYTAEAEGANYAMVTGDGRERYCFITDIEKDIGGRMSITLKEDPLMTFSTKIELAPILATRSSVLAKDDGNVGYNAYLQDGMWTCDATQLTYTSVDILNGFFDYDKADNGFILMTAG